MTRRARAAAASGLALLLTAAAVPPPASEAEALGRRLAASGGLAAMLPAITAKETEEMLGEHPEWTEADRAAFRATARDIASQSADRLFDAIGHGYATTLSLEDLRALVRFNESDTARRWRAAEPKAVMGALQAVGEIDFKATTRQAFCKQTGKGCPAD